MKLGDWVKVPDGRVGTVVYSGLDGFGIRWGTHKISSEDAAEINSFCPLFEQPKIKLAEYKWIPEAMLREKRLEKLLGMECVGDDKLCVLIGNGCR